VTKRELPVVNLARLVPDRRQRPKAGDVFCCLPPRGGFLYGRVVSTSARTAEDEPPGLLLLYFYAVRSAAKLPIPTLRRGDFLLTPILTNRLGFSRGYFEILERELSAEDVYPTHCFNFYFDEPRRAPFFVDENGRRLARAPRGVPVGDAGVHSYRSIDDALSRALRIRLAPE
jgi:hypothetical protein